MKKKTIHLLTKSMLTKLALVAALILGNVSLAVAEDIVIYNEGGEIPTGWTANGYISVDNNELVSSGSTAGYITSSGTYNFSDMKLVVVAQRTDDTDAYVRVSSSSSYYSYIMSIGYGSTTKTYEWFDKDNYIELISDNFSVTDKNLRISVKNAKVKSIKLCENKSYVLDEDNPTALVKGAKSETVTFKYTPKNGWNTICVPFTLKMTTTYEHMTSIFGSGWKAYKINSYTGNTLEFTTATPYSSSGISANTPYLVYAENAVEHPEGIELNSNISISYTNSGTVATAGDAKFTGTFAPMSAGTLTGKYGVTNAGGIAKGGALATMKGYRAYLELPEGATARILIIDNNGETTDLGFVKLVDQEAKAVYNLSGQRVEKGRKGLYIVNGKKVVVK